MKLKLWENYAKFYGFGKNVLNFFFHYVYEDWGKLNELQILMEKLNLNENLVILLLNFFIKCVRDEDSANINDFATF